MMYENFNQYAMQTLTKLFVNLICKHTVNFRIIGGCFFLSQSESETSLIEQKRQGLLELKYTIRD